MTEEIIRNRLRSWASSNFPTAGIKSMLSSPPIGAADVLLFTLEFVFNWNEDEQLDRDDRLRLRALAFVAGWLGQNPPDEEPVSTRRGGPIIIALAVPNLSRLCAQRIAMEVFPALSGDFDLHFDGRNLDYFEGTLEGRIKSALQLRGVPEHLHASITEELLIFTIAYFLFADVRKFRRRLPLRKNPLGEYEAFWRTALKSVPNHGRGSLAKAGLFPHALYTNYFREKTWAYNHFNVLSCFFSESEQGALYVRHPLADSAAVAPIASLVHSKMMKDRMRKTWDFNRFQKASKVLIPWIKRFGKDEKMLYSHLCSEANSVPKRDLPPFSPPAAVEDCINIFTAEEVFKSLDMESTRGCHVEKLRLSGNFSKGEILRAAIVSKYAVLVDLRDCCNLDEECLEHVLRHLCRAKRVMLGGTPIDPKSEVVAKAKNRAKRRKLSVDIEFVF